MAECLQIVEGKTEYGTSEENKSFQNQHKEDDQIIAQKFTKIFASNVAKSNNKKSIATYRSKISKQIVGFIPLIIKMVPVKDRAAKIIIFSAYRFRKMWNEAQEALEKKRGRTITVEL